MGRHDLLTRVILHEIEAGHPVSQRALSRKLGVALGLTNLLVRRIVKKGWVKVTSVKPNRVTYLITPAGIREKTRITRAYFENTVRLYGETRARIRESLDELSASWPRPEPGTNGDKRIVFYGAGEVAEIGYISLQGTDLRLVGVVDDRPREGFFGLPVRSPDALQAGCLGNVPYDRIVVMTFKKADAILAKLRARGFSSDRVRVL